MRDCGPHKSRMAVFELVCDDPERLLQTFTDEQDHLSASLLQSLPSDDYATAAAFDLLDAITSTELELNF